MSIREEDKPFANETKTKEEQFRILKKKRFDLLDEIHAKQQALDRLDFKIYELKNEIESERNA